MTIPESLTDAAWVDGLLRWFTYALWQGAFIGTSLALCLGFIPVSRTGLRYIITLAALVALVVLPAASTTWGSGVEQSVAPAQASTTQIDVQAQRTSEDIWSLSGVRLWIGPMLQAHAPLGSGWRQSIALFYALGVMLLSLRLVAQLLYTTRLRRTAILAPADLKATLHRLAGKLDTPTVPHIACSYRVDTAMVMGWRAPLILLPTGTAVKLTPAQLDGVLLHELAHVKRHDYLVNLLQCLAETLLFYHPVVWWLSSAARREREGCCDDLAANACGGPCCYVEALLALERQRVRPTVAIAVHGGDLTARVQRLLGGYAPRTHISGLILSFGLTLLLGVGMSFAQQGSSFFKHQPSDAEIRDPFPTLQGSKEFIIITADSLEYFVTLEGARAELPFDLYLPTKLPRGFSLANEFYRVLPQNLVLTMFETNDQDRSTYISLQQQPVETFQGLPVGASAPIKQVTVAGHSGEYVKGYWDGISETQLGMEKNEGLSESGRWVNEEDAHMLSWRQDGFVFTLTARNLTPKPDDSERHTILAVAASLASSSSTQ